MLKLCTYLVSYEDHADTKTNINFVVWCFNEYFATSADFRFSADPWLFYCYDQPLGRWNSYANLTKVTGSEDMFYYVTNNNCSVAEFREIVKMQGANLEGCMLHNQLLRRIRRIPEYEKIVARAIKYRVFGCLVSNQREHYEEIWRFLGFIP